MKLPRILIMPPQPWYMEIHAEYLVRYLSDQFFIEVADIPYPPYKDFRSRFPETQPYQRNPDDYDLLWPILPTHWLVEKDLYAHKVATVHYSPGEGRYTDVAVAACSTPIACKGYGDFKHHHLSFGVDTDLFKPLNFKREDDRLRIGMLGTIVNPRRMIKEVVRPLADIPGVKLELYTNDRLDNQAILNMGGGDIYDFIVGGRRPWPGIPNLYNRFDVIIRCDSDPGYAFPVLEAAACGVPVIATNQGIEHFITNAGGGILVEADEVDSNGCGRNWYLDHPDLVLERVKNAVLELRDSPDKRKEMGRKAREEVVNNWRWEKFLPAWRAFFEDGLKKVSEK